MVEDKRFNSPLSRRGALRRFSGVVAATAVSSLPQLPAAEGTPLYRARNNRINQSVIHWCFKPMTVEELAGHAVRMGLKSVELVGTDYWPLLKRLGLLCAIAPSHGFSKGFAHKEQHSECIDILTRSINDCAREGFPNVITFSGFRRGISDEDGLKNMVEGLKQIVGYAEKKKVTLCLEMLNSRVNIDMKGHPDYFCDKIEMAIEVCQQISSEHMKVLFDIYHVQIMEGDIITRIKQYHSYIGHYHTAGVPGRGELDENQELNYPAIMNTIVSTGYKGYVGLEFIPTRDKVTSLNQAVKLCDV